MEAHFAAGLRGLLVVVFCVAAYGKLRHREAREELAGTLAEMGLDLRRSRLATVAVVVAECCTVLLLCWPESGLYGTWAATALLAAFSLGVAHALRRGSTAVCRCFGASGSRLGRVHLARNLTLTTLAAAAAVLTTVYGRPPQTTDAVAALAGAVAGVVLVAWEDLAAVLAGPVATSQRKEER